MGFWENTQIFRNKYSLTESTSLLGFEETSWETRGDEVSWALLTPPPQPNMPQTHKYLSINYTLHYVSGFKSETPCLPRPSHLPHLPVLRWEGGDLLAHKCHSHASCFLQGSLEPWRGPWSMWTAASQLNVGYPHISFGLQVQTQG